MIADRIIAYALFAGFAVAAALGWDWDTGLRTNHRHQRAQQPVREGGDGVGRVHDRSNYSNLGAE